MYMICKFNCMTYSAGYEFILRRYAKKRMPCFLLLTTNVVDGDVLYCSISVPGGPDLIAVWRIRWK